MCTNCGCGTMPGAGKTLAHTEGHAHPPSGAGGLNYRPGYRQVHAHPHPHPDAPDAASARRVSIERDILAKNDALAAINRQYLEQQGILALNLVSSPGAGKTCVLERSIQALRGKYPIGVIEGDQQTRLDAERIRASGAAAVQINTGKGCHLDALMVHQALGELALPQGGVLFIENVGNLVCPAAFDLGEMCKVVILSVTEGEDKPLKYPDMFHAARLMLLNKIDLLPHLDFNVQRVLDNALRVNPDIEVIALSAATGEGMGRWLAWLESAHAALQALPGQRGGLELHAFTR